MNASGDTYAGEYDNRYRMMGESNEHVDATCVDDQETVSRTYDDEENRRSIVRIQNAVVRGAGIGLVLRGGFLSFKSLMSLMKGKVDKASNLRREGMTIVRWTTFLGSLAGTYVTLDEGISRVVGRKKSNKWRGLASGSIAGWTILLLGRNQPQYGISFYIFLRAVWLFLRRSRHSGSAFLRAASSPMAYKNMDVFVMSLACTQILYSWLFMPKTLPLPYRKFLDKHCGKPEWAIEAIREIIKHNTDKSSVKEKQWHQLIPKSHAHLKNYQTPYGLMLNGKSQIQHHISFFLKEYGRKIPVYIPVYFIPALLVHRWKLLSNSKMSRTVLLKCVQGTMQSSLFLTGFCTMAWISTSATVWLFAPMFGKKFYDKNWCALSLAPIGTSIILEKESRRKEIAAYCSARALESFALCALYWGWIPKALQYKRSDALLFSVAVGLIMHCYSDSEGDYRKVFRSKYLNVIDFVFGNTGHKSQKIRHIPSTTEIAEKYLNRMRKVYSSSSLHSES